MLKSSTELETLICLHSSYHSTTCRSDTSCGEDNQKMADVGTWTCGWAMEDHLAEPGWPHGSRANCTTILQVWKPDQTVAVAWVWHVTLRPCKDSARPLFSYLLHFSSPKDPLQWKLQLTVSGCLLTNASPPRGCGSYEGVLQQVINRHQCLPV